MAVSGHLILSRRHSETISSVNEMINKEENLF